MNCNVLKSKILCNLLNKTIDFNENELKSKMENLTNGLRQRTLVSQFIEEFEIKEYTVMVGARERMIKVYFLPFSFY